NTSSFQYVTNAGHTGAKSVKTTVTKYTSGDAKWYFKPVAVQPNKTYTFSDYYKASVLTDVVVEVKNTSGQLSYHWLGSPAASASAWKNFTSDFTMPANAQSATVYHVIGRVGNLQIDDTFFGLKDTAPVPTPPTVQLSAPAAGATLSGTQTVSANAQDAAGVASVQFKLDGANLGAPDTTAPYSVSWDTTTVVNGTHTLSAVATNTSGLSTASSSVSVNAQNTVTPPPDPDPTPGNLVPNPSVETASGTSPQSWVSNSWGANTSSLTYESTGRTGNHSLKAAISAYTDGDAKWYFSSIPVTAGKTYNYSNWYKSNVATELNAMVTMEGGSVQWLWLADVPASADWKQVSTNFTAPTGATNVTIMQIISSVGYVQT
ncbi:MAG: Ig-like domain-containing protein, partial [Acidobacteriota bacterium]